MTASQRSRLCLIRLAEPLLIHWRQPKQLVQFQYPQPTGQPSRVRTLDGAVQTIWLVAQFGSCTRLITGRSQVQILSSQPSGPCASLSGSLVWNQEIAGSNPAGPTMFAASEQIKEQANKAELRLMATCLIASQDMGVRFSYSAPCVVEVNG